MPRRRQLLARTLPGKYLSKNCPWRGSHHDTRPSSIPINRVGETDSVAGPTGLQDHRPSLHRQRWDTSDRSRRVASVSTFRIGLRMAVPSPKQHRLGTPRRPQHPRVLTRLPGAGRWSRSSIGERHIGSMVIVAVFARVGRWVDRGRGDECGVTTRPTNWWEHAATSSRDRTTTVTSWLKQRIGPVGERH